MLSARKIMLEIDSKEVKRSVYFVVVNFKDLLHKLNKTL